MAKLIIHRKNESFFRMMKFQPILNSKKIKSIKPGESITLEIPEGEYELKIKGGIFTKSNKLQFKINAADTKKFLAEVFKKGWLRNHIRLIEMESD